MADLKISDLPAAGAIAGGELLPVVQGGATKKATVAGLGVSANTPNTLVQRDASGNFSAGTITANVTGSSGSTTGNAATATALQTARNINGVSFNGSADITIPTDAYTDSTITPTLAAPHVLTTADIGKRLVMTSVTTGAVDMATNLPAVSTGDSVQIAATGAACLLYTTNSVDFLYNPNANNAVRAIAIQSDGKAIVGGSFSTIVGTARNFIARINTDGTLDTGYNPNADNVVRAIAIQSDGKAIIGGDFTNVGGTGRNYFARINTDGTLDTGYNPNADAGGGLNAVAIQSDGKSILGGTFTTISGTARNRIARINADNTLDTGYNPNANNWVRCFAIQSDGKALVGGSFTTIVGTARNRIARINTDGTLDTGYNPNINGNVRAIAIQSDGKAIVCGDYSTVGGTARNNIARINTDGTLDTGYNPNANNGVDGIAIQPSDGKAIVVGYFTTVGGTARNFIARINTDGTLDTGYNPNANGTNTFAVAIQSSNGNAIIGGDFTTVSGITRNRIARLASSPVFVTYRAPYTLPSNQVPQYGVLTLEKLSATEWWVTGSNAS
jgi:uncharacterized delta-60 repeat protein